ncbi:hypothetical protein [Saliphagus sp. LR7]|uniref:DUF7389 domain-containing protein n=1 Tax=Saliphagus sp. LR7 TaxID=2282654 RepID=UPI000DF81BDA|nr:hypothetical protein [Saliphagus sp. LR7]
MCDEETERVERTDVGVSISVELTRGTGTRDQDKIKAKAKGATLEDAREDMDELKGDLRELADVCRAIQPAKEGDR